LPQPRGLSRNVLDAERHAGARPAIGVPALPAREPVIDGRRACGRPLPRAGAGSTVPVRRTGGLEAHGGTAATGRRAHVALRRRWHDRGRPGVVAPGAVTRIADPESTWRLGSRARN